MSFRHRRLWLAALFLLCLFSLPVVAQVSAALSGRITDQSGAVVQGATVTAKDTDTDISRDLDHRCSGQVRIARPSCWPL